MAIRPSSASPAISIEALPRELQAPILRGLRWTLWLSALAMPLGYCTRLMLARTGPQVIGAFGLLLIYVRLVSTFLLLGGNAVLIQFLPQLPPERRRAFLLEYGAIVLLALAPWFAVAWLWPAALKLLFGPVGGARFQVILIWLSPIYIALSLSTAALKGILEIALAQVLGRAVTVGSFAIYAVLFFAARPILAHDYLVLIWGIYLTLAAVSAGFGLRLFWRHTPPTAPRGLPPFWTRVLRRGANEAPATPIAPPHPLLSHAAGLTSKPFERGEGRAGRGGSSEGDAAYTQVREEPERGANEAPATPIAPPKPWALPPGFWRYTLSLQGNSAIGFLSASLDSLLVLHWGGLRQLGMYVALMTLVTIIPTLLDLLLDTLLPSLTHAIAHGGRPAMTGLNEAASRVLFLAALALATTMTLFAAPLVALFGPAYHGLAPMLRFAAPVAAILAASHLYNTIFSAIGQPQRSTVAQSVRLAVFVLLFAPLWHAHGLAGAVWAWAASEMAHHFASLYFVRRGGLHLPFPRGYVLLWLGLAAGGGLALAAPHLPYAWAAIVAIGIIGGYTLAAGYRPAQIRAFLRLMLPGAALHSA